MLYDPKWEVKAEPTYMGIGLQSFVAWLGHMPENEPYNYADPDRCAAGQYSHSLGLGAVRSFLSHDSPVAMTIFRIVQPKPWTFGAALSRARALLIEKR